MCYIDLEPCSVWRETGSKARKPHTCDCCGRTIEKSEMYVRHFSVLEGDITHEAICAGCAEDRQVFADAHESGVMTPSYFPELLGECIAEGDEESETLWAPMLERIRARQHVALADKDDMS